MQINNCSDKVIILQFLFLELIIRSNILITYLHAIWSQNELCRQRKGSYLISCDILRVRYIMINNVDGNC